MREKLKVYELAKEMGVDSQHLVDVVQRLGIDVKNSMSILGSEEVRTVRDHYKKNRPIPKVVTTPTSTKGPVTEKRVGATVIRRRKATDAPEPVEAAEEGLEEELIESEEAEGELEVVEEEAIEAEEDATAIAAESTSVTPKNAEGASTEAPKLVVVKEIERKPRRLFPSIIKKVGTEQHLVEKVGPKLEKKERPAKEIAADKAKPKRPQRQESQEP